MPDIEYEGLNKYLKLPLPINKSLKKYDPNLAEYFRQRRRDIIFAQTDLRNMDNYDRGQLDMLEEIMNRLQLPYLPITLDF